MKKLTLDETWRLCLSMWRWIAKIKKNERNVEVYALKKEWLKNHGFRCKTINSDCFFCEYVYGHSRPIANCYLCPARKVDKEFDCVETSYDHSYYPVKFYNKLVSLNRKRLAKKRKKK